MPFPYLDYSKQGMLSLEFLTIPDPDGWHPSLRLKGDWLVIKISDGVLSGYGEASHSKQDNACKAAAQEIFTQRLKTFQLSLKNLRSLEEEVLATQPDFVRATAWSGINQALYDLLAKREQVPVWQLFKSNTSLNCLSLYTTINRALTTRTYDDYLSLVQKANDQGFKIFKCAPFGKVTDPNDTEESCREGLGTLALLREKFPEIGMRVDFHERFAPENFIKIVPELEGFDLDWIEEPFAMGDDYTELRKRTKLRIAGGELFWGTKVFSEITENQWVHVIMPDVKYVGGFGPLLLVLEMGQGRIEISPHNPSGPVSTAASLHAAAIFPDLVQSLEIPFDKTNLRKSYGECIEDGYLYLNDNPGWGLDLDTLVT